MQINRWLIVPLFSMFWGVGAGCGGNPSTTSNPVGQTVVLVSIDGFRWDYIDRPGAVVLRQIAESGVRARTMQPVFPTKTFPNHYSIVTGLHPERHGIVSNTMEDSELGRFSLGNRDAVTDARWWAGEPIWVTAQRQGLQAAPYFWPGSEAAIGGIRPTYWKQFDDNVPNETRVQWVLDALAMPVDSAPSLISVYFSEVDHAGHGFGPDSPDVDSAIASVDRALATLWEGIGSLGLRDRVNLVIVSDHGMTPLSPDRMILLDELLDEGTYRVVDWTPVAAIVPEHGREDEIVTRLSPVPHLTVFPRREVPARLHYNDNPRIQPVLAMADDGWQITSSTRARARASLGGDHGYDNAAANMGALFVAAGPAFSQGVVVDRVRTLDLYELMCRVLGIDPSPNDGALDSIAAVLRP